MADSASFGNGGAGISHGAYVNSYRLRNIDLFANEVAIDHHALSRSGSQVWRDVDAGGDDVVLGRHRLQKSTPVVYRNLRLRGGRIVVDESGAAGVFEFRSDRGVTDLDRGDFEVVERLSRIVVHNSDGSSFEVR